MSSGFIPGVIGTVPVGGTTGQVLTKSSNSNYSMVWATLPPPASVMGPSGPSHASGLVPDPGATLGATHFLREDATWAIPSGTGGGLTDPTTTVGDLIVRGSAAVTRLPVGVNGQVLTANSVQALGVQWVTPAAAPVTSVFGRTGVVVAAAGDYTAAQVTNAVSTTGSYSDPAWITGLSWSKILSAPAFPGDPTTTKGDLIARGAAAPATRLGVGTDGQVLKADSTQLQGIKWAAEAVTSVFGRTGAVVAAPGDYTASQITNAVDSTGSYVNPSWIVSYSWTKITGAPAFLVDPTTTLGDIIVRGSAAPATRLAVGTNGQVLTADSSQTLGVKWATPSIPVSSVFGRTGAVVAQAGDYTASQVTNAVSSASSYSDPAWITGLSWSKILSAPTFLADPTTTKGDLIARGAAAPPARLPVGADGQVLTCDSTQTLGVKWAASASAPVTSVFGRTGAVSASPGDYSAAQITNAVSTANTYSDPAWLTGLAWSKVIGAPSVSSYQTPWVSNINGATFTLTNVSQIGVAVTSPTYPLEVYGVSSWSTGDSGAPIIKVNASSSAYIQFMPGNPYRGGGISFFNPGTPNTYQGEVGFDGYGSVRFISPSYMLFLFGATGGAATETMRVVSGRVGIGTTSPATVLHVASAAVTQVTSETTSSASTAQFRLKGDARTYQLAVGGSAVTGGLANCFYIYDETAGVTRAVITSAGLVGIGTLSPAYTLDVNGSINSNAGITCVNGNATSQFLSPQITAGSTTTDGITLLGTYIDFETANKGRWTIIKADAESSGNAGSNLYIQRWNDAGTLISSLVGMNRAAGNVTINPNSGIAVATTAMLEVNGNIRSSGSTGAPTTGAGLELLYSTSGYVQAYDRTGAVYKGLILEGSTTAINGTSKGAVGIGTLSPAYALDVEVASNVIGLKVGTPSSYITVNGGDGTNAYVNVPSWGFCLQTAGANRIVITNGGNVAIGSFTPSYLLQLASDSGAKPTTNTWTIPSDIRLKKNVHALSGGLSVINRLQAIEAEYNGLDGTPEGQPVLSFDPAAVRTILPRCVSSHRGKLRAEDEETDILDFNIHEILMHLIVAVQQLSAKVNA